MTPQISSHRPNRRPGWVPLLIFCFAPPQVEAWILPLTPSRQGHRAVTVSASTSTESLSSLLNDDSNESSSRPAFFYGSAIDDLDDEYDLKTRQDLRFRASKRPPLSLPHLFRHHDDISFDSWLRCADPEDFWVSTGYNLADLPEDLREAPVHEMIAPHLRFLVDVLKGGSGKLAWIVGQEPVSGEECEIDDEEHHSLSVSPETQQVIPHSFYRCSMERYIAPWHAYLQHHGLTNGAALLKDTDKITHFCNVCASGKVQQFAELCQDWADASSSSSSSLSSSNLHHTVPRIQAFARAFRRGLFPAVKNAICADLDEVDCTPSEMVQLLVSHGANFLQKDKQGVDLLHWAAGTHHWTAVQILLQAVAEERYPEEYAAGKNSEGDVLLESTDSKDGATPLHWAACGFGTQSIGTGGNLEVCAGLLQRAGNRRKELVSATTWYGATPLMWAAWAGPLEVVLLFLNAGADPHSVNNKKQSAAHWAAAAGNLSICQCLHGLLGENFFQKDADGKTALDYAETFGRTEVFRWLHSVQKADTAASS